MATLQYVAHKNFIHFRRADAYRSEMDKHTTIFLCIPALSKAALTAIDPSLVPLTVARDFQALPIGVLTALTITGA